MAILDQRDVESAYSPTTAGRVSRLVRAGLLTGVSDGLFASVLSVAFFHSTVARVWQGVASTVLGKAALDGGLRTAAIGLLMHFGVAFAWSAVFLILFENSADRKSTRLNSSHM